MSLQQVDLIHQALQVFEPYAVQQQMSPEDLEEIQSMIGMTDKTQTELYPTPSKGLRDFINGWVY
jgi:hypothetical protein